MFGKSTEKRITDTLAVIENATDLLNLVVRQQISTWVSGMFPRLTLAQQQTYDALSGDMSVKANIARGVAKGQEPLRAKRRAIFLLWTAIGKARQVEFDAGPRAKEAMSMPPTALDAAFSEVMFKAAAITGVGGAAAVLDELKRHPVRFLKQNRLFLAGTSKGDELFSTAANGPYRNVLNFYFQYDAGADQFRMGFDRLGNQGEALGFDAVSVPALAWSKVPGVGGEPGDFGGVVGCEVDGADIMVTTQLTGCSFGWTDDGVLRACHISPGSYKGGGIALAQRLMKTGKMANASNTPLTIFGAGAGNGPPIGTNPSGGTNPFYPNTVGNNKRISIFGVKGVQKDGGAWRFYLQAVEERKILEARRIR
jgi:hypothetical protein